MTREERLQKPCPRGHPLAQRYFENRGRLRCRGCDSVSYAKYYRAATPKFRKTYQWKKHKQEVAEAHRIPDLILVALRSRPYAAQQLARLLHVGTWSTKPWIRKGIVRERYRVKQVVAAVELGLILPRMENVAHIGPMGQGGAL